jgi:carboxymethylenebutenolidase
MPVTVADLVDIVIAHRDPEASDVLRGVLAVPDGPGPWPAVVVVHELFGIDDEMRKQLAHLANLGYLAVMPDLFSMGGMRKCLIGTMSSLRSGRGRAYADIEAARQFVLDRPDATGAVGVLGFCMGGGFALMTAASGFGAASTNYGQLPSDLDAALEGACPVVGSYGGRDVTLKGAAAKLDAALTRHGIPHDIKEYSDAGHVFMNDQLNGWPWIRPIVRVLNFGPNPRAAADAWARIDAFFGEHLAAPASRD